jgi:hypothetical protein
MSVPGMGGWKDVHSGTPCQDAVSGDGGRSEPPGGDEVVWRSPEHDHLSTSLAAKSAGHFSEDHAGTEVSLDPPSRTGHRDDPVGVVKILRQGRVPHRFSPLPDRDRTQ